MGILYLYAPFRQQLTSAKLHFKRSSPHRGNKNRFQRFNAIASDLLTHEESDERSAACGHCRLTQTLNHARLLCKLVQVDKA